MSGRCFANLTPHNSLAIRLASKVYEQIRHSPQTYAHHLKYLNATGPPVAIRALLGVDQSPPEFASPMHSGASSEATVPDEDCDPMNDIVWPTCYRFALPARTLAPRIGWIAGYGHGWEEPDSHGEVDLLVAVDVVSRNGSELRSSHARFNFFSPSGRFGILCSRRGARVTVNGLRVGSTPCLLTLPQQQITLGELEYQFAYTVEDQDRKTFQLAVNEHFLTALCAPLPNSLTSFTPSVRDEHVGKWTFMETAGGGTESIVRAGVSSDGSIGAVILKEYFRHDQKEDADEHLTTIQTMTKRISQTNAYGKNNVMRFYESILTNTSRMYIITVPLGVCDLSSAVFRQNNSCHENLFAQAILGVDALHQSGYLHGDIKTKNIVVVTFTPPEAAIIDIVGAFDMHLPKHANGILAIPGRGGTVGYLAPEREASETSRYGFPSDIWSLGIVGWQIFSDKPYAPYDAPLRVNPFRGFRLTELEEPIDHSQEIGPLRALRNRFRVELEGLKRRAMRAPDGIESLLVSMLEFRPERRITASDACSHPFVANYLARSAPENRGKRRRSTS